MPPKKDFSDAEPDPDARPVTSRASPEVQRYARTIRFCEALEHSERGPANGQPVELVQHLVQNSQMDIPISEAKARLTELVRQAEAGEEILLTRHGRPIVSLKPITRVPESERRALMLALSESAAAKASKGATAARSQDFLYDEDGLPR